MNDCFYNNFLEALADRFPRKSNLVNALMDILPLKKESIYRRLRKDVPFTLEELMQIASVWNISIDNIICTNPDKTRPFHFNMIAYLDPQEADYKLLEEYNRKLELIGRDPDGQMIEVTNSLPRSLYGRYENLTRFFTLKWLYKYDMPEDTVVFGDVHISERMRALDEEYVERIHNIPKVHELHDPRFIEHLIDDINYFRSIRLITGDEVDLLKNELMEVVDYMENIAIKGYFSDTGNKLFFYLSHIWLETDYLLCESKYLRLSLVKILERNSLISSDKKVFQKFMNMALSTKHSSVLLSDSNSLQRAEFFSTQRDKIMSF